MDIFFSKKLKISQFEALARLGHTSPSNEKLKLWDRILSIKSICVLVLVPVGNQVSRKSGIG